MDIFHYISLWNVSLFAVLLSLLSVIYSWVVKPYLMAQFYRKQGCIIEFFPVVGNLPSALKDVKKHGDLLYQWKALGKSETKFKIGGTNKGRAISLYLFDPALIKEFINKSEHYVKDTDFLVFYKELFRDGVAFAEGKTWKRHRRFSSMAFHYDLLKLMVPEAVKIIQERFDRLQASDMSRVDILVELDRKSVV